MNKTVGSKVMINGTIYYVNNGKILINGTIYSITTGKTIVDGTVRALNINTKKDEEEASQGE